MFPHSSSSDFKDFKDNYLYTSNESISRKEDRILNKDYTDPYKYERKLAYMYERDNNSKIYNLTSLANESFKTSNSNIRIEEAVEENNTPVVPTLNFKYEDYNKYKRKDEDSNRNSNTSGLSSRNNYRYKSSNMLPQNEQQREVKHVDEYKSYDNDLNYYREMIEKMHSEIGNLNCKLNDLETNNNVKSNACNSSAMSCTNYNSNLSTANFRNNKIECSEKTTEILRDPQYEINLRSKTEKVLHLEREPNSKDYLLRKKDDSVLVQSPQYIINDNSEDNKSSSSLITRHNNNLDNKDIAHNLNTKSTIQKQDKARPPSRTPSTTKARSNSMDKFKSNNKIPVKSSQNNLQPKSNSKNKRSTTPSTPSKSSKVSSNGKVPSKNYVLNNALKENEELKEKVFDLEKSLRSINYQTSLDTLEKRGKDHLRVELEIWKNRSETIANSYLETMSNMKKQLMQDKINFLDQIKTMQNTYSNEINGLKSKYQSSIEKQEGSIKKLKKENEELKSKVSKVKEILNPNK